MYNLKERNHIPYNIRYTIRILYAYLYYIIILRVLYYRKRRLARMLLRFTIYNVRYLLIECMR